MTGSTVYTRRLGAVNGEDDAFHMFYEVPADTAVVLRDVILWNGSTVPNTGELTLVIPGMDGAMRVATFTDVPEKVARHTEMRQAMEPGEQLWIQGNTWPYTVLVTGYVFE